MREKPHHVAGTTAGVRSSDVDATILTFQKDSLIAEYSSRTSRWQGIQAASLGAVAVALLGVYTGNVTPTALFLFSFIALFFVGLSVRGLAELDKRLRRDMSDLQGDLESLKRSG